MPSDLLVKSDGTRLEKGDVSFLSDRSLLALCWRDRSFVTMLSNCHSSKFSNIVSRVRGGNDVFKPQVIMDYNAIMGGVDLKDQMVKYYSYFRKSIKWYKRLFFTLMEVSLFNSYVLWKKSHPNATLLNFRVSIVSQILAEVGMDPSALTVRSRPGSASLGALRLSGRHFPALNPPSKDGKRPASFRVCIVCNAGAGVRVAKGMARKRTETKFQCIPCGSIPLCPAPCFEKYHTLLNFQ